ncbi:MAG: competence/damage-inducible protein A [Desulfarculus sp.]|nr:MAG: competence/damage-inducible protein A [Desulfarculus sp.]
MGMEFRLLEKTELWVEPLRLAGADLGACARAVAGVLGLSEREVMVTDALDNHLTFDVLAPTLRAEQFVAREAELLRALAQVPGVEINGGTQVHSAGILGLISLEPEEGREMLARSQAMGREINRRIQRRARVFATGPEVLAGEIQDSNTPFLLQALTGEGFAAEPGPILEDQAPAIARGLRRAAEEAFGLLITTGGVGAEGKDQTLEALASLDPSAATPYVLQFIKGNGRHAKDGVRLGVGCLDSSLIVCLPGPHDEVRLLWPVLREGLAQALAPEALAHSLAQALRAKFLAKSTEHKHGQAQKLWEEIHGTEQG